MSAIGQIDSATLANSVYNTTKNSSAGQTDAAKKTQSQSPYGNTVGDAKLSEAGAKYYEELKSKYSDMDFVLVSNDKVDQAEQLAAKYANPDKTLVLIDAEKVEKMAEDEEYRKSIENTIETSGAKLDELAASLEKSGMSGNVAGFGISVKDDGTTSYFAVLKDSSDAQKARIEKQAAEKREAKKAEQKKADKKAQEKKLEESGKGFRAKGPKSPDQEGMRLGRGKKLSDAEAEGLTTVSANSVDELLQKVSDTVIARMSDNIRTPEEMQVGQHFDMKW